MERLCVFEPAVTAVDGKCRNAREGRWPRQRHVCFIPHACGCSSFDSSYMLSQFIHSKQQPCQTLPSVQAGGKRQLQAARSETHAIGVTFQEQHHVITAAYLCVCVCVKWHRGSRPPPAPLWDVTGRQPSAAASLLDPQSGEVSSRARKPAKSGRLREERHAFRGMVQQRTFTRRYLPKWFWTGSRPFDTASKTR